jgi:hypothetical protein
MRTGGAGVNALALCGRDVIATGGVDNAVRLFDARSGLGAGRAVARVPHAHASEVLSLCAFGAGKLASGGGDETVRVWDLRALGADHDHNQAPELDCEGCSGSVFALAHAPAHGLLLACSRRSVCGFADDTGAWTVELEGGHDHDVYGAVAYHDGALLTCGEDGRVCEWSCADAVAAAAAQAEREDDDDYDGDTTGDETALSPLKAPMTVRAHLRCVGCGAALPRRRVSLAAPPRARAHAARVRVSGVLDLRRVRGAGWGVHDRGVCGMRGTARGAGGQRVPWGALGDGGLRACPSRRAAACLQSRC